MEIQICSKYKYIQNEVHKQSKTKARQMSTFINNILHLSMFIIIFGI